MPPISEELISPADQHLSAATEIAAGHLLFSA